MQSYTQHDWQNALPGALGLPDGPFFEITSPIGRDMVDGLPIRV